MPQPRLSDNDYPMITRVLGDHGIILAPSETCYIFAAIGQYLLKQPVRELLLLYMEQPIQPILRLDQVLKLAVLVGIAFIMERVHL